MNAEERKQHPVATGVVDYFPDALMAVANCSWVGNEQHNPGATLHWDRSKSTDEADALLRHFLERGTFDTDGVRHSAKVAWRALALLQKEIENDRKADHTAVTGDHRSGDAADSGSSVGSGDERASTCRTGGICPGCTGGCEYGDA